MAILAVERDEGGSYAGLVLFTEPEPEAPMMEAEHVGGPGSDFEEDLIAARERADELGENLIEEASVAEYRAEREKEDLIKLGRFVARLLRDGTATIEETETEGGEDRRRYRLVVWEPYDEPETVAFTDLEEALARRLAERYGVGIRPLAGGGKGAV